MSIVTTGARRPVVLADVIPGTWVRDVVCVAVGVLLLAGSAQVAVPLPFTPVPITGQTFAVLLLGAAYGLRRGLLTMLAYLAVGLAGGAVFSPDPATGRARTGEQMLHAPSAGYVVGMVAAVALLGWLSRRAWDRHLRTSVPLMVVASLVIYACGVPWLAVAADLTPGQALVKGLVPFLVGDAVKLVLAAAALPTAWRLVRGRQPKKESMA
jgi:biotin transport system substrate-specific component